MRSRATAIVNSKPFTRGILILIILNSITLGIETFTIPPQAHLVLAYFNWFCTIVFIIEIILKCIAYKAAFLKDGWNIFDVIIIGLSILPEIAFFSSARILRILRVFKVFRTTRLIGHIENLQNVIQAMLHALPSIGWTVGILMIVYYVYAVMGTNLYAVISPDYFGNLWISFYTLFQITMGDEIGGITRFIIAQDPAATLYFVSFMIIAVMLILNLIIGVIVNSIEEMRQMRKKEERMQNANDLEKEIDKLEEQLILVREMLNDRKQL